MGQDRKVAALSGVSWVPRGCLRRTVKSGRSLMRFDGRCTTMNYRKAPGKITWGLFVETLARLNVETLVMQHAGQGFGLIYPVGDLRLRGELAHKLFRLVDLN